jgi:hypothetical protein
MQETNQERDEIIYRETMLYIENNELFYNQLIDCYKKTYEFYKLHPLLSTRKTRLIERIRKIVNEAVYSYKIECGFNKDYYPKAKDRKNVAIKIAANDYEEWKKEQEA